MLLRHREASCDSFIVALLLHTAGSGSSATQELLDYLTITRLVELDVVTRSVLVCAIRHVGTLTDRPGWPGLPSLYSRAISKVLLGTFGPELSVLKDAINISGSACDLFQLLYRDIGSLTLRYEILQHFAAQATLSVAHNPDACRPVQLVSDFDDTLAAMWVDQRFPRGTVYPGVSAFVAEVHGSSWPASSTTTCLTPMQTLLPGWWDAYVVTSTGAPPPTEGGSPGAGPLVRIDDVDSIGDIAGSPHSSKASDNSQLSDALKTTHAIASASQPPRARFRDVAASFFKVRLGSLFDGSPRRPAAGSFSVTSGDRDAPRVATMLSAARKSLMHHSSALLRRRAAAASHGSHRIRKELLAMYSKMRRGGRPPPSPAPAIPSSEQLRATPSPLRLHPPGSGAQVPTSLVVLTARPADYRGIIKRRALLQLSAIGLGLQMDRVPVVDPTSAGAQQAAVVQAASPQAAGAGREGVSVRDPVQHKRAPAHAIVLLGSLLRSTSTAAIAHKKGENLAAYRALWPEAVFALLGDSGQGDAAVAAAALDMPRVGNDIEEVGLNDATPAAPLHDRDRFRVRLAPIVGAFIHNVNPGEDRTGDGQLKEVYTRRLGRKGFSFFESYAGAAGDAARIGLLAPAAAERVRAATAADLSRIKWDSGISGAALRTVAERAFDSSSAAAKYTL